jgi:hypothetical protein
MGGKTSYAQDAQSSEFTAVPLMLDSFFPQCLHLPLKTCHLSTDLNFHFIPKIEYIHNYLAFWHMYFEGGIFSQKLGQENTQ